MPSRREVYILSKWEKQRVLAEDPKVSRYSPETCLFDWGQLSDYLAKYEAVYIKPVVGAGGRGIMRVSKLEQGGYLLQAGCQRKQMKSWERLRSKLDKRIENKSSYMLQQGIDVLTVDGKPVDFRLLLLKSKDKWKYMGVMGKQAAKDKMVTNHIQGGKALTLRQSLKKSGMGKIVKDQQMEKDMRKLAKHTSAAISEHYPHVRELGLDVAMDKQGKLWVLEANTKPAFKLFRHHPDSTLHPRISEKVRLIRSRYTFWGSRLQRRRRWSGRLRFSRR
ncbi:YheC/YheD family protein [Ammoniphilus sp. 3BR4]|uniref:YheC/YheD family protein n=1 Tax=Ammoniphilus sp. 3BR4 TaxID=3158265 RepID=UPI003467A1E0